MIFLLTLHDCTACEIINIINIIVKRLGLGMGPGDEYEMGV